MFFTLVLWGILKTSSMLISQIDFTLLLTVAVKKNHRIPNWNGTVICSGILSLSIIV